MRLTTPLEISFQPSLAVVLNLMEPVWAGWNLGGACRDAGQSSEAAALLHSAYSYHQIGAFQNLDQPVEDTLIIVRSGLEVFLQYPLRFANGLKRQLLISHCSTQGVSTKVFRHDAFEARV